VVPEAEHLPLDESSEKHSRQVAEPLDFRAEVHRFGGIDADRADPDGAVFEGAVILNVGTSLAGSNQACF
jgi:hypothetical protein